MSRKGWAQAGRLGWTTADQALSSATNAGLSFLVAREVSAEAFGAFALAFVAFVYANGVVRALVSDPLIVRFSAADRQAQDNAIGDSAGSAVLVGTAAGALSAVTGLVLGGLTGELLLVLGAFLAGLALQDHWRLAFFASDRPRSAFVNDLVWATLQIAGVVALIWSGRGGVAAYLAVWGASGSVAAGLGAWQAGVRPRLSNGVTWIREHRDIGVRYTWSFLINQGAFNAAIVGIGALAGVAAVGALRAAQVLLGPMRVAFSALSAFALPILSRQASWSRDVLRPAVAVSVAAAALTLAWTGLLLLVPDRVGQQLLGETWALADQVVGIHGLQVTAIGLALGAWLGLKALSEAGLLMRVALVEAAAVLAFGAAGAAVSGLVGGAIGLLLADGVGAAVCWWLFRPQARGARRATP